MARTRAAKVGKGLSKDEKEQKLALQHWLEADTLEDISYLLRIPQRKPYGTMEGNVKKALKLALVGTEASKAAEDYWKSVWPNTPVPKALEDLLLPYSETDLPIKDEEEKQYWSVFFEHELHPGKK